MVRVYKVNCPFNPHQNLEECPVEAKPGLTLLEIGADYYKTPWLCVAYLGGRRYFPKREEWGEIYLQDGDIIYWFPHVGGVEAALATVIVAGITVADVLVGALIAWAAFEVFKTLLPPVGQVGDLPEPDPVWTLSGQRNQNRLGNSIQDGYGRLKLWPSYAARPYNQFYNNDQFQYQLLCLGHGSWDVEDVFIEDTDIDSFQETTYAVYKPGQTVTLFPDNVETSVEVPTKELLGTNEAGYPAGGGWFGPYTANATQTDAIKLEVDVVFPNGLFYANDNGGLDSRTVTLEFEYREIDDAGTPVGSWTDFDGTTFSKTFATNTPQRFTIEQTVTAGRYEVRGRRTNAKDESHRAGNTANWVNLRAFRQETREYGDVTLLAVKARATNNLNDRASNRINCIATRELPDFDAGTDTLAAVDDYGNRTATRNPVWAAVNILRAEWGAGLADQFLDLSFLGDEAAQADTDGIHFDHVFDTRMNIWDSVKACLFVFKATPILKGSLFSMVRDAPATVPAFFINPENTVAGSFQLNRRLYTIREYDGLDIEYLDDTTWKAETVEIRIGGEAGDHPRTINLPGVTSRQKAHELGFYLRKKELTERQQVTVRTGMEGYLPMYNDLGRFGSDIPSWSVNGFVESIVGDVVTLSEDVTFEVGETYQIALRGKVGQDLGPYTVTAGAATNQVNCPGLPAGQFFFDEQHEPPYFMFGKTNEVGKIARVVSVKPVSGDSVEIVAVVDDQSRFDAPGSVVALPTGNTPPTTTPNPAVSGLQVNDSAQPGYAIANWDAAQGATFYKVEISSNGTDWSPLALTPLTSHTFPVMPGTHHIRVWAESSGFGASQTWTGTLGDNQGSVGLRQLTVTTTQTASSSTYGRFLITTAGVTLTLSEQIGNQVISVANKSSGDAYLAFDIELRGKVTTSPVTIKGGEVFELIYDETADLWRF